MKNRPGMRLGFGMQRVIWGFLTGVALDLASVLVQRLYVGAGMMQDDMEAYRLELRGYILGLVLALGLTGAAFATVEWSLFPYVWCEVAIGVFALIQVGVHFRYFLHMSFSEQHPDDLHVALFSGLIVLVMIGGTVWIMADLAARMR